MRAPWDRSGRRRRRTAVPAVRRQDHRRAERQQVKTGCWSAIATVVGPLVRPRSAPAEGGARTRLLHRLCRALCAPETRPGATPKARLKALAKANSEVYPICWATTACGSSPSRRIRAAALSRHQITYAICACPTKWVARLAKTVLDMPSRWASSAPSTGAPCGGECGSAQRRSPDRSTRRTSRRRGCERSPHPATHAGRRPAAGPAGQARRRPLPALSPARPHRADRQRSAAPGGGLVPRECGSPRAVPAGRGAPVHGRAGTHSTAKRPASAVPCPRVTCDDVPAFRVRLGWQEGQHLVGITPDAVHGPVGQEDHIACRQQQRRAVGRQNNEHG